MSGRKYRQDETLMVNRITLSSDGKQLTMRIPKEISEYMHLKAGDKMIISLDTREPVKNRKYHTIRLESSEPYGNTEVGYLYKRHYANAV